MLADYGSIDRRRRQSGFPRPRLPVVFCLLLLSCIGLLNFFRFSKRKLDLISIDGEENSPHGRTDKIRSRTEGLNGNDDLDYGEPGTIDISSFTSQVCSLLQQRFSEKNSIILI